MAALHDQAVQLIDPDSGTAPGLDPNYLSRGRRAGGPRVTSRSRRGLRVGAVADSKGRAVLSSAPLRARRQSSGSYRSGLARTCAGHLAVSSSPRQSPGTLSTLTSSRPRSRTRSRMP